MNLTVVKGLQSEIFVPVTPPPVWAPVTKPLNEMVIALATAAGVHRKEDKRFNLAGDFTWREIYDSTPSSDLMVSHGGYDNSDVNKDINCMFPIDRLHELAKEGFIKGVAPVHIGFMVSMPAGSNTTTPPNDGSMKKFPSFEGKDLNGNTVKSDKLFSGNAVTVVNFWFTTCNPCVGELAELDALNKKLAEKGGTLIGVNTFTLGGDEAAISEAKDVLMKKGATYQNVYFASDSEAGKFASNILAYPTTYVVDRNGNIVGEPIVGAITEKKQAETLQKLIDQALAADMS